MKHGNLISIVKKIYNKARIFVLVTLFEKKFGDKGKYLYLRRGSDKLIIVFSAFNSTKKRRYNYIDALNGKRIDRLYIMDCWSDTGSYYMYENGRDYPKQYVQYVISQIINGGGINKFSQQAHQWEALVPSISV